MKLHEDKYNFEVLLDLISQQSQFSPLILQKDYWVTFILKKIAAHESYKTDIVFKGGTSLSKCYSAIERFSEDIDLCVYKPNDSTRGTQAEKVVKRLHEIIPLDLFTVNKIIDPKIPENNKIRKHSVIFIDPIKTGTISGAGEFNKILVEINRISQPTPFELLNAQTLLYSEMVKNGNMAKEITNYELEPFKIQVMSLARTFCEKISAVARNSATFKVTEYRQKRIRHYYDLYKLYNIMGKAYLETSAFEALMSEVMEDDYKGTDKAKDMYQNSLLIHDLGKITEDLKNTWNDFKDLLFPDSNLPNLGNVLSISRESVEKAAKVEKLKYSQAKI
jgi:predicted nucleotidyltransferase component of viral defense system